MKPIQDDIETVLRCIDGDVIAELALDRLVAERDRLIQQLIACEMRLTPDQHALYREATKEETK